MLPMTLGQELIHKVIGCTNPGPVVPTLGTSCAQHLLYYLFAAFQQDRLSSDPAIADISAEARLTRLATLPLETIRYKILGAMQDF